MKPYAGNDEPSAETQLEVKDALALGLLAGRLGAGEDVSPIKPFFRGGTLRSFRLAQAGAARQPRDPVDRTFAAMQRPNSILAVDAWRTRPLHPVTKPG